MRGDSAFKVGLVTTASRRWPEELPRERHERCSAWLSETFPQIELVRPASVCVTDGEVRQAAELLRREGVGLVFVVIGAFTGDAVSAMLAQTVGAPVVLWALGEPPFDGTRLVSNALVSATMNAAALRRLGHAAHFVYGDHSEDRVRGEIARLVRVHGAISAMRGTFLGLFGYRPTGFYSSAFNEAVIRRTFGVRMEGLDLAELFDRAAAVDAAKAALDAEALAVSVDLKEMPEAHRENHSRLYFAMKELIAEQGFDAVTLKCWPEMASRRFTPCAVISRLADDGHIVGCEGDVDATLTMIAQRRVTGGAVWMCDLITVDEAENTALFWHCGQAPRALMADERPRMMDHSLAGRGAVFEGTLKPGRVTVARFSDIDGRYKLFLARGEAVETEKPVRGVVSKVRMSEPVLGLVYRIAKAGIPHHYSIVWDAAAEDLALMAECLGVEVLSA